MALAPGPKNQNGNIFSKAAKTMVKNAPSIAQNVINRQNQNSNNGMPDNAIEQTWGGYNYNLMDQGQFAQGLTNPLNGTGHVAGFPQGPEIPKLDLNQQPQADAPVQPVTNVKPTKKTSVPMQTPVEQQEQPQGPAEDIVNRQIPESWKKQETEQEPEIVEQPFEMTQAQGGKIYGKFSEQEGEPTQGINTLADPYGVESAMYKSKESNYNALQNLSSYEAAVLITDGISPYGDQALRDLMQFNPEKYQQIQDYIKEIRAGDTIDAISHGQTTIGTSLVETTEEGIKSSENNWIDQNSTARTKDQVSTMLSTKMEDSITAGSAKQQMMIYKDKIVDLQYELEDLPKEAKRVFKGDAPEYLVKARMSNKQQEIQAKMDKLESKYNAMADIYKTEMSQMQRQAEMELKYRQLELQQTNASFDMWYKSAQLEQNQVQRAKDAQGNMKAYKIVNGQVIQVDDGTAYQGYTTTVSGLVSQANQMASAKATGGQCEAFTDNMAQKAAGVRMVGTSAGGETTAAEKAWYATQFGTFSDYIPEVGDVAVFTNNGSNGVSKERGHTMYVTGYDPATGIVSMVGSNNGGDERVYSMQYSLGDFYNKGGQGFWNPYKYAQWTAQVQGGTGSSTSGNPMEATIDNLIDSGKLNATQTTNISKFGYAYETLRQSKQNGELDSLLQQGAAATFFQELAVSLANTQSGQSVGSQVANAGKITLDQFVKQVELSAAQKMGEGSAAYMGFMSIVGVIESKLRRDSGAAINGSERAMNFLEYLPQAGDDLYTKNRKLEKLDTFLRYWAKEGGITGKDYVPIFTSSSNGKRSIE